MLFVLIAAALGPLAQAQTVLPVLPAQFEHRLAPQLTLTHHANRTQTIGGQEAKNGPNGWLVVGGLTVGMAVMWAAVLPRYLAFGADSIPSTWLERAAFGAGLGAVLGLTICLGLRCDWSKPKAPEPPTRRPPRAAVLVGAGTLGMRITW